MMPYLYRLLVGIAECLLPIVAGFSKGKLKLFVEGRKGQFKKLNFKKTGKTYWFHCASLGEFEQARPVIEALKSHDASIQIIVSFFSASGYEQRKNYAGADLVCYMPLDTPSNAEKFLNLIQADVAVFVKYEIWYWYLKALKKRGIPTYLLSATFRENQYLFKWHAVWLFAVLKDFKTIFLQDERSYDLLKSRHLENIVLSGDTRYDRVKTTALASTTIPLLEAFKSGQPLLLLGSSWPEEEDILKEFLSDESYAGFKVIVAPHDVSSGHIKQLETTLAKVKYVRFTDAQVNGNERVLILDTIGHLANAYHYADMAFIGGGFGRGLHNILEALAYGVPVVFGPEVNRYPEARASMASEVAYKVADVQGLGAAIQRFLPKGHLENGMRAKCLDFINWHAGATDKVIKAIQ